MEDLSGIRQDYHKGELKRADLSDHPFIQFRKWMDEALQAKCIEPTAMNLATVSAQGKPSSRIVLLKEVTDEAFTFFTNYTSRKGHQLMGNQYAALAFFWPELERQVRIEGRVEKIPAADSDAYFQSRPRESRLGAWASHQSTPIEGDELLQANYEKLEAQYQGREIPRPGHWGGYRLLPECIEFWQGRSNRMHDRFLYQLIGEHWQINRLAP